MFSLFVWYLIKKIVIHLKGKKNKFHILIGVMKYLWILFFNLHLVSTVLYRWFGIYLKTCLFRLCCRGRGKNTKILKKDRGSRLILFIIHKLTSSGPRRQQHLWVQVVFNACLWNFICGLLSAFKTYCMGQTLFVLWLQHSVLKKTFHKFLL